MTRETLGVLIRPQYWMMLHALCPLWDAELTALLDRGARFTRLNTYEAQIGPFKVWTENHPYASFTCLSGSAMARPEPCRPRRATILRAWRHYCQDTKPHMHRHCRIDDKGDVR